MATDNDFNEHIAKALRERLGDVEVVSIRDAGLARADDPVVLDWAARTGHVVVTHDVSTMTAAAYHRLKEGEVMPGLVVVPQKLSAGEAARRLALLIGRDCQNPSVAVLPMRFYRIPLPAGQFRPLWLQCSGRD